jgi:hypothetical protein
MRVCTVLRSGGEYKPEHVQRLAAQVEEHLPGVEFFALSDVPVPGVEVVPMVHNYPKWWGKIELMSLPGPDFLCVDLDTTITGSLRDIAARTELTLLADFYRPHLLQTGLMLLPEATRQRVWSEWLRRTPPAVTRQFYGDGNFMNAVFAGQAATWQTVLPGQVVSYKIHVQLDPPKGKHIGNGFIPPGARIVCHHGHPRPWAVPAPRFQ